MLQFAVATWPADDLPGGILALVWAGLVLSVTAILVTIYWGRRQAPRQRLSFRTISTPLLHGSARDLRDRLGVSWEGTPLSDPHLVQVVLHNSGRVTISESMYDRKRPFVVELHSNVVVLLDEENSHRQLSAPPRRLSGSQLHIGPGAVHSAQTLSYSLLVDGRRQADYVSSLVVPLDDARGLTAIRQLQRWPGWFKRRLGARRSAHPRPERASTWAHLDRFNSHPMLQALTLIAEVMGLTALVASGIAYLLGR
jgi:hypothetical protein